jgi:dolichol-phosphate mannosyltransferase
MIYFLIPVYNESENLPELSKNLISFSAEEDKFYVFVDDCSTDGTVSRLRELFPENKLQVIEKDKNGGPGDSFNRGFNWILQHSNDDNDKVVTVEGDNTSDLEILPVMLANSKMGFGLVLASVYAQGGGFDKTSAFRKIISFMANMIFRALFDLKVLTMSSFYRVYSLNLLKRVKNKFDNIIEEKGFICMLEVLLKSIKCNAKIIEVPMVLKSDKRVGKSKMKIFKTTISYLKFLFSNFSKLRA